MNISEFKIEKLYGKNTFKLLFDDNTVILVGENGAGKTTILRLLFYFISGQWDALQHYEFDSIAITINAKEILLSRKEIISFIPKGLDDRLNHLPSKRLLEFYDRLDDAEGDYFNPMVRSLLERHDISTYEVPYEPYEERINSKKRIKESKEAQKKLSEIKTIIASQILYLPTYRRIEQDFESIFKEYNENPRVLSRKNYLRKRMRDYSYIELIEFGMKDVESAIENILRELKEFSREELNKLTLGYLGDVVEKKYDVIDINHIKGTPDKMIRNVLDRIEENILSQENKTHLSEIIKEIKNEKEISEHTKVICHYFLKLLKFQEDLEKREANIKQFCTVCNGYLSPEKYLNYDSSSFEFSIRKKDSDTENYEVQLKNLSSGEKQIVSLFSHLYLSGNKKFFILIDEPELSLSVPWQKRFLSDVRSSNLCSGIVAVTHSPFIYENELKKYARSLGEFVEGDC